MWPDASGAARMSEPRKGHAGAHQLRMAGRAADRRCGRAWFFIDPCELGDACADAGTGRRERMR